MKHTIANALILSTGLYEIALGTAEMFDQLHTALFEDALWIGVPFILGAFLLEMYRKRI